MIQVWNRQISLRLYPKGRKGWRRAYCLVDGDDWYCKKHGKWLCIPPGFESNGADKVADIISMGHFRHDYVVGTEGHEGTWKWADGTPISVKQSSDILRISMEEEGYKYTAEKWWRWTLAWQALKRVFKK